MASSIRGLIGKARAAEWLCGAGGAAAIKVADLGELWGKFVLPFGILLAMVPVVQATRRELEKDRLARDLEEIAAEYDARLGVALRSVIGPIAYLIGRIAEAAARERPKLKTQLCQLVVDSAVAVSGIEGARSVFFEVEGDDLRPQAFGGRGDEPRTRFRRGDGAHGDQAFGLIGTHGFLRVPDMDNPPPGVDLGRTSTVYRGFISAAVYSDRRDFGLLNLDATAPNAFSEADENVLRALAQLLGAGLSVKDPLHAELIRRLRPSA